MVLCRVSSKVLLGFIYGVSTMPHVSYGVSVWYGCGMFSPFFFVGIMCASVHRLPEISAPAHKCGQQYQQQ